MDKRLSGLSLATIKRLEEHYKAHPARRRLEEVVMYTTDKDKEDYRRRTMILLRL